MNLVDLARQADIDVAHRKCDQVRTDEDFKRQWLEAFAALVRAEADKELAAARHDIARMLQSITALETERADMLAAMASPVAIVHVRKLMFHDVHINNHEWIEWKLPKRDGMKLYGAPVLAKEKTDD